MRLFNPVTQIIFRQWLAICAGIAVLATSMPAKALAPKSAFGHDQPDDEFASVTISDIVEGRTEPNFWLGGKDSGLYKALNPKAEITIRQGEDISKKLISIAEVHPLQEQDIVLIFYYKNDPPLSCPDPMSTIRLVAAPLSSLKVVNSDLIQSGFAHREAMLDGEASPFLFEQTVEIDHQSHHRINCPVLYVDPSLRSGATVLELSYYFQRMRERFFNGYEITATAASLYVMSRYFTGYGADLAFDTNKRVWQWSAQLEFLLRLGLLEKQEITLLNNNGDQLKGYVATRDLLYEILRIKWARLGEGNTLQGIMKRLSDMRSAMGRKVFDNLLLQHGGFAIKGTIGEKRFSKERQNDAPFDTAQRNLRFLRQKITQIIAHAVTANSGNPILSPFALIYPHLHRGSLERSALDQITAAIQKQDISANSLSPEDTVFLDTMMNCATTMDTLEAQQSPDKQGQLAETSM